MSRNVVAPETAERNASQPGGGYTFNALIPPEYAGVCFTVAALRLGDHAHLDIESGRAIPQPGYEGRPHYNCGRAGRLILRWHEWEVLRALLDQHENVHIAEVQQPTKGQLDHHLADAGRAKGERG